MSFFKNESVTIEGTNLIFRNFEGKEGVFNAPGVRSFGLIIPDEEIAEALVQRGYKVKHLKTDDPNVLGQPWLPIAVSYKGKNHPQIVLLTKSSKKRTVLSEETCQMADWVNVAEADVTFRPYDWTVRGESGTKAYLVTIYIIVEENYLELKYSDWENQEPLAIAAGPSDEYDDYVDGDVVDEEEPPFAIEARR